MRRIKPLSDWVCVKPIEFKHAFLYVAGIRLRKGTVLAVGPGRRMRRKIGYRRNPERADEVTYFDDGPETGVIRPMRVKEGDVVEFSFRMGPNAKEVTIDGERLMMVKEQSIYGLTSAEADSGILEHEPMSVDAA